MRLRPNGRGAVRALLLTLAISASSLVVAAAPAQADVVGPAYYLYSGRIGGPCVEGRRTTDTVNISPYKYRTDSGGHFQEGNYDYRYFWERGFSSAWRYGHCRGGGVDFRYYGKQKITRKMTQTWLCWATGCNYVSTGYGSWYNNNW